MSRLPRVSRTPEGHWTPAGAKCAALATVSATITCLIVIVGNIIFLFYLIQQVLKSNSTQNYYRQRAGLQLNDIGLPAIVAIVLIVLAAFVMTRSGNIISKSKGSAIFMIVAALLFAGWYSLEFITVLAVSSQMGGVGFFVGFLLLIKFVTILCAFWMLGQSIAALSMWPKPVYAGGAFEVRPPEQPPAPPTSATVRK